MSLKKFVNHLVTGPNGAYLDNSDPEYLKKHEQHKNLKFTTKFNYAVGDSVYVYAGYLTGYTARPSLSARTATDINRFINDTRFYNDQYAVIMKFVNGEPVDFLPDDIVISNWKKLSEPLAEWSSRDTVNASGSED